LAWLGWLGLAGLARLAPLAWLGLPSWGIRWGAVDGDNSNQDSANDVSWGIGGGGGENTNQDLVSDIGA